MERKSFTGQGILAQIFGGAGSVERRSFTRQGIPAQILGYTGFHLLFWIGLSALAIRRLAFEHAIADIALAILTVLFPLAVLLFRLAYLLRRVGIERTRVTVTYYCRRRRVMATSALSRIQVGWMTVHLKTAKSTVLRLHAWQFSPRAWDAVRIRFIRLAEEIGLTEIDVRGIRRIFVAGSPSGARASTAQ